MLVSTSTLCDPVSLICALIHTGKVVCKLYQAHSTHCDARLGLLSVKTVRPQTVHLESLCCNVIPPATPR